jgi:beta-phosphoglucomutase-like phosphatase (HAD superfamily)
MSTGRLSDALQSAPVAGQPYDAILWDMDGTLADSEPVHKLSFELACQSLGISLPDGFHGSLLGKSEEESHAWLTLEWGLGLSLHEWMSARFAIYKDHIGEVTFQPDAKRLWDWASDRGIPQSIVSNSDRIIVGANLDRLGLARPGLVSVSRNDVRCGKPSPEPYLRAAQLLALDPVRLAIVEDSETGARSGIAAGMTVYVMPHFSGGKLQNVQPVSALASYLVI